VVRENQKVAIGLSALIEIRQWGRKRVVLIHGWMQCSKKRVM